MSELRSGTNCLAKCLLLLVVLMPFMGSVGNAATINISGNIMGTATVDLAGRCATFPTVSATGTGFASGIGNVVDSQSHCTNGNFAFDQGIFELTSTDTPENSLFGTYTGSSLLQGGLLGFTATLLVAGGTGVFASASGTLQSSGSLNESTGAFNAQFSGSVSTVPELSAISLVGVGIAVVGLIRSRLTPRFSLNAHRVPSR